MSAIAVEEAGKAAVPGSELSARRAAARKIDGIGIIATPSNSSFNELVLEAARLSISRDGVPARILDTPAGPCVKIISA